MSNKLIKQKKNEGLVVLSLFDGMSCGRLALEKAKIPIDKYFASEIKDFAIEHTKKRYPDTISIGDVTKIHYDKETKTLYSNCNKKIIAQFGEVKTTLGWVEASIGDLITSLEFEGKDAWTEEDLENFKEQGFVVNGKGEVTRKTFPSLALAKYYNRGFELDDNGNVVKTFYTEPELKEYESQGFKPNKNGEMVRVAYTEEELKSFKEKGYETCLASHPSLSGEIVEWDITNATKVYEGEFDILIGGSPCQNFSMANSFQNSHQYGLAGEKSRLFNEYFRLKNEISPNYFFLENVKMRKESEKMLNEFMGVNGLHINSNAITIQHRDRIYWTNIKDFANLESLDTMENNIPQPDPAKLYLNRRTGEVASTSFQDYIIKTVPRVENILREIRFDDKKLVIDDEARTKLGLTKDEIQEICEKNKWAREELEEARKYMRKQTNDKKYSHTYSDEEFVDFIHNVLLESLVKVTPSRNKMWNDGKTAQFACKNITNEDKMSCLTRKQDRFPNSGLIAFGDYCRFVTRLEICKGQTVPYSFLQDLTYAQIQDVCGDGWTVDVIAYIFGYLKQAYEF